MRHASLFSGIGGFDLAAEWMGWENVIQCEIDPFCQKYLRLNFPSTTLYGDIKQLDGNEWRGKVDILTGGFPCQPFSQAGKRRGTEDDRHLWPEMLRVIQEIQPRFIVGENVSGLNSSEQGMVLEQVYVDLENAGYSVTPPLTIPACAVEAWHRRDRIWIVAHSDRDEHSQPVGGGQSQKEGVQTEDRAQDRAAWKPPGADCGFDTDIDSIRAKRRKFQKIPELRGLSRGEDIGVYADIEGRPSLSTPVLCRSYDGIPEGVARVKAYGNAIVPQVAYRIFQAIESSDKM